MKRVNKYNLEYFTNKKLQNKILPFIDFYFILCENNFQERFQAEGLYLDLIISKLSNQCENNLCEQLQNFYKNIGTALLDFKGTFRKLK
jgi:hypothetical protein